MTQTVTLQYLFDPLCGWCYGASASIKALAKHPAIDLQPMATGLFSGTGAKPMKSFAAQAWAMDQRIGALSGLRGGLHGTCTTRRIPGMVALDSGCTF